MKYAVSILLVTLAITGEINCNCGCLKCNKNLQVISPPYYPLQVILNASPCAKGQANAAALASTLASLGSLGTLGSLGALGNLGSSYSSNCQPIYAYNYQLQAPVPPPPPPPPMTGLIAKPDRLVLQKTNCPVYTGDNGDCSEIYRPPCRSIFSDGGSGGLYDGASPLPLQLLVPNNGPIIEPVPKDMYQITCDCRYDHGKRKKRELPIFKQSVNFLMGLIPRFLIFPFEQTIKALKYHEKVEPKPSRTFLQKLQRLNRVKRSIIFGDEKISLPFLKVTDLEEDDDDDDDDDYDDQSEENIVSRIRTREDFLKPLNFDQMLPHNPIFYLLNTPIRLLHHFHQLGQQISPVFKSVPHVFINSKKYLRDFGKNLKNDVLNFASDFVGDFDDMYSHNHKYIRPRRYKRNLEQYQPEYSLVFGNETHSRKKRYILKVVDEDEVEEFLREKLGGLVETTTEQPKKKREKDSSRKKLVVERLSSKLIIDNNGRPFVEINGVKRPLFLNRKTQKQPQVAEEKKKEEEKTTEQPSTETEDVKEKINYIITQAKERISQNPQPSLQPSLPNQIIKERINQILTEIQYLINLDFSKYSTIHSDLCKLENFKELLVKDWKKILMEGKGNDISSKIHLLDDFKEMQNLRDKAVEDIASILSSGSNFMTKKLIKMLVRLQKLQCLIYRVVEDFGEKIKMGTNFDIGREIKFVDFLANLHFIVGQSKQDLENDLKRERDRALENEMVILDVLRKLADENHNNPEKLYEEAQLLWEIKNIDKLQKDTILEMNGKISRGQKVRKELKILFDLLKQQENCEEKQKKLLIKQKSEEENSEEEEEIQMHTNNINKNRQHVMRHLKPVNLYRNRNFPHKTIIEDKKPVKLVSNGYTMTAYKVSDGFN